MKKRFQNCRDLMLAGISLMVGAGITWWALPDPGSDETLSREAPVSDSNSESSGTSLEAGLQHANSAFKSSNIRPAQEKRRSLQVADAESILISKLTPESARGMLARIEAEVRGIRDRAVLSAAVIQALCAGGYGEEAWQMVGVNRGTVREAELETLFRHFAGPANLLLTKLQTLDVPKERSLAWKNLIGSRPDGISDLDLHEIPKMTPEEEAGFADGVSQALCGLVNSGKSEAERMLLEKSLQLVKEGKISSKSVGSILNDSSTKDPFGRWETVEAMKNSLTGDDFAKVQSGTIQNMARTDINRSMDLILSDAVMVSSPGVLGWSLELVHGTDAGGAERWLAQHMGTMDGALKQQVLGGMAGVAIKSGDFNDSRRWAAMIEDTEIRASVLQRIEGAEAKRRESK